MAGDSTGKLYTMGNTEECEAGEMAEGVASAGIFNSGSISCVNTLTGVHEVPEASLPLRADPSGGFGLCTDKSFFAGENALSL